MKSTTIRSEITSIDERLEQHKHLLTESTAKLDLARKQFVLDKIGFDDLKKVESAHTAIAGPIEALSTQRAQLERDLAVELEAEQHAGKINSIRSSITEVERCGQNIPALRNALEKAAEAFALAINARSEAHSKMIRNVQGLIPTFQNPRAAMVGKNTRADFESFTGELGADDTARLFATFNVQYAAGNFEPVIDAAINFAAFRAFEERNKKREDEQRERRKKGLELKQAVEDRRLVETKERIKKQQKWPAARFHSTSNSVNS